MSSLNPSLIFQGRQPDIIGQMARGQQLGRQNALASLYAQHGPGIVAGDQNALSALAAHEGHRVSAHSAASAS